MKLTEDDLRCMTHDCECGAYFKNGDGYIKQILKNQEDAEKWKELSDPNSSVYGEVLGNLSKLAGINHRVVERLHKRVGALKKLLENKDLTSEESMELQYWLRENAMALGEYRDGSWREASFNKRMGTCKIL